VSWSEKGKEERSGNGDSSGSEKKTNSSKSNTWDAGNSHGAPSKSINWGFFSLWVLIILYLVAIFADFLAPNNPYDQRQDLSYAPPSKVHWTDEDGKLTAPYIYALGA